MSASLLLRLVLFAGLCCLTTGPQASGQQRKSEPTATRIRHFRPHARVQFELQEALINASPGDILELAAGTYHLNAELNVACTDVTLRGAGADQTVMSFRNQSAGSSGLVATGSGFTIEGLAIEDTAGNAVKVLGARDVTFRDVRVEWTDGPNPENGAYGIYPVECQNVLIENCVSIGASDAGIYVGQSQDVIVRDCRVSRNVAGIEIENTRRADVFGNSATDNTGGILVFDLPGLNLTNGGQVRVFRNSIKDNNHDNFAPKGTMVADVPSGTGVMIMAMDDVEVFDNDVTGHQTANALVVSFEITNRRITDPEYDAWPERISIHDNRILGGGIKPSGLLGTLLSPITGGRFPDIIFDGIRKSQAPGKPASEALSIRIRDNGDATFACLNLRDFSPANVLTGKYRIDQDLEPYGIELERLAAVSITPRQPQPALQNPAAAVYRNAPRRLSEWKLFVQTAGIWKPAADLIPYELNTALYSDDTVKHRYIRLPEGQPMHWHETESLQFPVGTLIAKTFAYPDSVSDATPEERWLETRIEFLNDSGWYGFSYVWNQEQSDAVLSLGGESLDVAWTSADGTMKRNVYQIPNANQCISCHSSHEKYVPLGTTARNLNCGTSDHGSLSQLDSWIRRDVLRGAPSSGSLPALAVWDDPGSGSLDQRARAWLEVNCAHCHNPTGSARTTGLDLRTAQQDPAKLGVFKSPVAVGKGSGGRMYDIVPGKPDESILTFRLESDQPAARMPSLGRNLVHHESAELVREWIRSMPGH